MANNKQYLTFLSALFLCMVTGIQAQYLSEQPIREQLTGGGGEEKINCLSENWQGMLAATGTASKGDNGGSDIYLLLTDKNLNSGRERHIGRSGDDGAYHIRQIPDGRWIVSGYSEKPAKKARSQERYFGKRDGWVLLLDESGRTEKEFIFGSPENDEFMGAFPMPDGSFILTGTSGPAAWWMHLTAEGKVIQEKKWSYHDLPTRVLSAATTPDGITMLTG
ncbi:MAG: hypothetical protein HUU01_17220, partial [Saprospiraceae bacterium]|nr:hypothetical protein [Saprospiraceae bacterium]